MEYYISNERKPVSGLLVGKVIANYHEDYKGMVQVSFYAYSEKANKTDWMRVLSPMAGKEKGFYSLPDVGDMVVIGFINQDTDTPVVLGSLWNDEDIYPKQAVTKENTVKAFVTKAGTRVMFSDEKEKEKIEITTPKELSICIDDEKETIQWKDKNGTNIILLNAKKGEITLTSNNKVVIQSKEIELKAETGLKMQAPQIEVNAKGQLKLQSSGMAEIKGSMVKING